MQLKTDGQLLRGFVSESQIAFEELTQRHAAVVLGVCERLLSGAPGADDAAQAVFLTLARKAHSLSDCDSVAGWLHRVSCQVALRARETSGSATGNTTSSDSEWNRLRGVVDLEIDELSEKHRVPLMLQNFHELNQEEAARLAGCSSKLLAARLERSRELLRDRLARRGIVISVGILAMHLSKHARAEIIPNGFVTATAKAARLTLDRQPAASENVTRLVQFVLRQMLFARLRIAAVLIIAGCVAGAFASDMLTAKNVIAQSSDQGHKEIKEGWFAPEPEPAPIQGKASANPAPPPAPPAPAPTPEAPKLVIVYAPQPDPVIKVEPPKMAIAPIVVKPGLSLNIQPLKPIFGVGETPVFSFVYKNTRDKALSLSGAGPSAVQITIETLDPEKTSWRFDGQRMFAARTIETALSPAQTCSQKVPLFGRLLEVSADLARPLQALPAGKYRLTARVSFSTPRSIMSADTPEYWDGQLEGSGEFEVHADRTASLDR